MRFALLLLSLLAVAGCTTRLIYRIHNTDPAGARIFTQDIDHFWQAFDSLDSPRFVHYLEEWYLADGSPGLRAFDRNRIEGADKLAATVRASADYYRFIRPYTYRVQEYEPAIREIFQRLANLYDDARFPDVYFLIGRLTSGGTLTNTGLLIGTEMHSAAPGAPKENLNGWLQTVLASPERIPTIVAHELIHYQQKYPLQLKRSLLSMAINEGAADFVGEKLCGATINDHIHAYGDEHEAELWAAFSSEMYDTETGDWLYNGQPANGQPADMGYYIGYRICEAYFEQQDEPRAAIKDILEIHDFEDFLRESGYGQQF
ncbi:MAG: hypothetical protein KDC54_00685 [Lewinella sp.]|nr:hypothetical protein [Lewinella sp.]